MEGKKTWKIAAIGVAFVLAVLCIIWLFGVHNFELLTADITYIDQDNGITLSDMDTYDFTLEYDVVDLVLWNLGSEVYLGDVTLTIENDSGEVFFTISSDELKDMSTAEEKDELEDMSTAKENKLYVGALKKGNYRIVANSTDASFTVTFWIITYARGYQWLLK